MKRKIRSEKQIKFRLRRALNVLLMILILLYIRCLILEFHSWKNRGHLVNKYTTAWSNIIQLAVSNYFGGS